MGGRIWNQFKIDSGLIRDDSGSIQALFGIDSIDGMSQQTMYGIRMTFHMHVLMNLDTPREEIVEEGDEEGDEDFLDVLEEVIEMHP